MYVEFMGECRSFIVDFDDFARRHRMDFIASYGIDRYLTLYAIQAYDELDPDTAWTEFAEYEITSVAKLFGVRAEILQKAIREVREASARMDPAELTEIFRRQLAEN